MGIEVRQAKLLAHEIVERPARAGRVADDTRRREARRSGKPAAQTPLALAGHDSVDRQRQRIELRRLTARDHVIVEPGVLVDIELEQLRPACERRNLLDAARGEAGDAEPQPEFLRRLRHRRFALPVKGSLHRGGREHQRQRASAAKDRAGRVDFGHAREHIGHQIDCIKSRRVPRLGPLVIGGTIDIVEHGEGQPRFRQPPEIVDIVAIGKAHRRSHVADQRRAGQIFFKGRHQIGKGGEQGVCAGRPATPFSPLRDGSPPTAISVPVNGRETLRCPATPEFRQRSHLQ